MPLKQSKYLLKFFIENKEIARIGAGYKNESFKFVGINLAENLTWKIMLHRVHPIFFESNPFAPLRFFFYFFFLVLNLGKEEDSGE